MSKRGRTESSLRGSGNGILPMETGGGNEESPKYQRVEEGETSRSTNFQSETQKSNTDFNPRQHIRKYLQTHCLAEIMGGL